MRSKKMVKLVPLVVVTSVVVLWYTSYSTKTAPVKDDSRYLHNASIKTILYWNNFFEYKHMGQGVGHAIFDENQCPVRNCYIWDIADGTPTLPVEDFDLVWFHGMDLPQGTLLRSKPHLRKPHQKYLFYLLEAPSTFQFDLSPLDDFFNWTATYRRDSDIFHPYGVLKRKDLMAIDDPPTWIEPTYEETVDVGNKTRLVAWIVSNCVKVPSNRDVYVEELSKHITIDVFGSCGMDCDRRCKDSGLEDTYKFYLAFENSACKDYVTEKFFRTLKLNVVPVVYGGADYKTVAPPMSYIDVSDYASPEELAKYLIYLDENPKEYVKYFWWKKHYTVNASSNIVCQVCEMLNKEESNNVVKSDLDVWWNGQGVCQSVVDAGVRTWLGRTVHYPGQVVNYSVVRLLATGNYAMILFILILVIVTCYCVIVLVIRLVIRKMWNSDYMTITLNHRYRDLNRVLYEKPSGT